MHFSNIPNGHVQPLGKGRAQNGQNAAVLHGSIFKPLSEEELRAKAAGESIAGPAGGSDSLYICDEDNNRIRVMDLATRVTRTIAGSGLAGLRDGSGQEARFMWPGGLSVDGKSGTSDIYVQFVVIEKEVRRPPTPQPPPRPSRGPSP